MWCELRSSILCILSGALVLSLPLVSQTQTAVSSGALRPPATTIVVVDENGRPVSDSLITLESAGSVVVTCQSDYAGRCRLQLTPGVYRVHATHANFYAFEQGKLAVAPGKPLQITLTHIKEVKETLDVVASAPVVDVSQPRLRRRWARRKSLTFRIPALVISVRRCRSFRA